MKENIVNTRWLSGAIKSFVEESDENTLGSNYNEKAWESPLVGFSRGDDELYTFYKKDIGDFYWTPCEIFSKTFPVIDVTPQELSIISWVLPQTRKTKEQQQKDRVYPVERAVLARVNGDKFNIEIGNFVVDLLCKEGYAALCPMLSPFWESKKSEKYSFASTWSERHTAYVCGLGTFGLSDGLITSVGKAIRCGSVIAKINTERTERPYSKHNEYCLFFKTGSCMKCAQKCPAGAITEKGHDKLKCREYQKNVIVKYINQRYNINAMYCGVCQFGVPCESAIPTRGFAD
jgi:epoxyqueuosine reductase